jgi:hypothetical protein
MAICFDHFFYFSLYQVHPEVPQPNRGMLLSMIGDWEAPLMVQRPLHLVLQHPPAANLMTGTLQPTPGVPLHPIELQRKRRLIQDLHRVVAPLMMIGELVLMRGHRAEVQLLVEEQHQVQAEQEPARMIGAHPAKRQPVVTLLRRMIGIPAGDLHLTRRLPSPLLLPNLEVVMTGEPKLMLGQALREGQLQALTKEMIGEALPVQAVPGQLAQMLLPNQEVEELLHGVDPDPVLLPSANQLQSTIGVYLVIHQLPHLLQLHLVAVQQHHQPTTTGVQKPMPGHLELVASQQLRELHRPLVHLVVAVMIGHQQLIPGPVEAAPRPQRLVPANQMIHGAP